ILSVVGFGTIGLLIALPTLVARFGEDRNEQSKELRTLLNTASREMLHDSAIGIGWNNYALVINPPWSYGDVIDDWTRERGFTVDPEELKPQPESHYWLIM